jgi:hypothetical protein
MTYQQRPEELRIDLSKQRLLMYAHLSMCTIGVPHPRHHDEKRPR